MSRRHVNLNEEEIKAKIEEFQDWIKTQTGFPQNLDEVLLARYLKIYSFRLDRAQQLLKHGLELRKKNPWFFTKRDPSSPEMKQVVEILDMNPLFQRTKDNYKVCIYQLLNDDASKVVFNDCVKAFFLATDFIHTIPIEKFSDLESGEIIIFDMKNLTFKHLTKLVISTLRLYFRYLQDAFPVRIVQLHVINCTPLINKAMMCIKPFIYAKLYNALKFHNAGSYDSLYEFVPREILPIDYGGQEVSMAELKKYWTEQLHARCEILTDDRYFKLTDIDMEEDEKKVGGIFSFLTS